jgi:hypothetical protein
MTVRVLEVAWLDLVSTSRVSVQVSPCLAARFSRGWKPLRKPSNCEVSSPDLAGGVHEGVEGCSLRAVDGPGWDRGHPQVDLQRVQDDMHHRTGRAVAVRGGEEPHEGLGLHLLPLAKGREVDPGLDPLINLVAGRRRGETGHAGDDGEQCAANEHGVLSELNVRKAYPGAEGTRVVGPGRKPSFVPPCRGMVISLG